MAEDSGTVVGIPTALETGKTVDTSQSASVHQFDALFSKMGYRPGQPGSVRVPFLAMGNVHRNIGQIVLYWLHKVNSEQLWLEETDEDGNQYTSFLDWYNRSISPYLPQENTRPYFASLAKAVVVLELAAEKAQVAPSKIISSSSTGSMIELGKLYSPYTTDQAIAESASEVLARAGVSEENLKLPDRKTVSVLARSVLEDKRNATNIFYTYDGEQLILYLPEGVSYVGILTALNAFGFSTQMKLEA